MTRPFTDPWKISLPTLIGTSPLLGHALEERASIREGQDLALAAQIEAGTSIALRPMQRSSFVCAPLDVMMSRSSRGIPEFHILELNGTGIGGITNLPEHAVGAMLDSLEEIAAQVATDDAIIVLAVSGKENDGKPRHNRLMHEKLLFADALRRGLARRHGRAGVVAQVGTQASAPDGQPTVVVGYMKDLFGAIECDESGRLSYDGRPVRAVLNDRFCTNLTDRTAGAFVPERTLPINACFLAGSDKSFAYSLFNDFVRAYEPAFVPRRNDYEVADDAPGLIAAITRRVRGGQPTVIKPRGTGIGHGIEFFLDPRVSGREIAEKVSRSIELTSAYYGLRGGAFPYTVCDFIDSCTINAGHALAGHRFEFRVVVYREEDRLRAFPMAVKVAPEPYDPSSPTLASLINNVTASAARGRPGSDYLLPLANRQTLELIGLSRAELQALCSICNRYVGHVLDRLHDEPEAFGLCTSTLEVGAGSSGFSGSPSLAH
jgi:hypothetical protein